MSIKIQWHPAFCSGMELILLNHAKMLKYIRELNLSQKPLQADLFVLYLDESKAIENAIGHHFKKYNLIEYKSPGDSLTIDDYYKTVGYCCQFKTERSDHINSVKADKITLTLVRYAKPIGLFKALAKEGIQADACFPGIYRLSGRTLFATYVICTKELPYSDFIWLTCLTRSLDISQAKALVEQRTGCLIIQKNRSWPIQSCRW